MVGSPAPSPAAPSSARVSSPSQIWSWPSVFARSVVSAPARISSIEPCVIA